MAGSVNKVILIGNLTRDVELKYTQSNKAVARIGLAMNSKWKGQDGTWKEEVTFVDCEAWGTTAENMSKYLTKGRQVYVEGRLKLDEWEDQSGQKRSKLKVVIESCLFIGGRPDGEQTQQQGYATGPGASAAATKRADPQKPQAYTPISDDDIPW